jgi:hypothetical protein
MMKDLDKSTYMLEHSIRLDAMGQIDAAAAEREKAAAKLMKHDETITTLAVDKYKLDQTVAENAKNRESQESIAKAHDAAVLGAANVRSGNKANSIVALGAKLSSNDGIIKDLNKKLRIFDASPEYAAKNSDKHKELLAKLDEANTLHEFYTREIGLAKAAATSTASEEPDLSNYSQDEETGVWYAN